MRGNFRHGKRGGGENGEIYSEDELEVAATCRKFRQVAVNESKKDRARRSLIAADNFTAPTRIDFFPLKYGACVRVFLGRPRGN